MPREKLTDEERKKRRAESVRRYYEKNREKCIAASLACRAKDPERHKEVQQAYRERNADRIKVQGKAYRAENRERINSASRQWQIDNPEKYQAYQREYRKENADRESARVLKWRQENEDLERARKARYDAEHLEDRRVRESNRRASKKVGGGRLSLDIKDRLMVLQKGKCACCLAGLDETGYHLDHIDPLARGGEHADHNIQLLCPACNLSKNAKPPIDFMQERGFLL